MPNLSALKKDNNKSDDKMKPLRALLAISALIVCGLFAEVIFLRGSFQPSNVFPQTGVPESWRFVYTIPPLSPHAAPAHGYSDLGATAWLAEPARYWLASTFATGESPYWNPYSAAGSLGPEILVDGKFSPLTLISAMFFNGSAISYDIALLVLFFCGALCLLLVINRCLQLSIQAAIVATLFYLLNGFSTPNLNSLIGLPYFLFPIVLFSLLCFSRRQSLITWLGVILSHVLLFSVTLMPTMLLVFVTVHAINLAWIIQNRIGCATVSTAKTLHRSTKAGEESRQNIYRISGLLLCAGLVSALLLGPLWLPILASQEITQVLGKYNSRTDIVPFSGNSLLSVFTPKHFWENYSGVTVGELYPGKLSERAGVLAHIGIFAAIIASMAVPGGKTWLGRLKAHPIIIICLLIVLCSYLRVFGLLPIFGAVPVLRSIAPQYWGAASSICLVVLVAYGMENLRQHTFSLMAPIITFCIAVIAFAILFWQLDVGELGSPYVSYVKLTLFSLVLVVVCLVVLMRGKDKSGDIFIVLPVMAVLELFFYMNHLRPERFEPLEQPPAFVSFIKQNIDDGRVFSIGRFGTLYPEYGAMYGIRQAGTQSNVHLPWYADFYRRNLAADNGLFLVTGSGITSSPVSSEKPVPLVESALDLASVHYILVVNHARHYLDFFAQRDYPKVYHDTYLTIFENPDYLPMVRLVSQVVEHHQTPDVAGVDGRYVATSQDSELLELARQAGLYRVVNEETPQVNGTVNIEQYRNTELVISVEAEQASLLVLSETWHPSWKAVLDDQPAYVGRVNEAFRGVVIPTGKHTIRLYYKNRAIIYGKYCFYFAVVLLVVIAMFSLIRNKKNIGALSGHGTAVDD